MLIDFDVRGQVGIFYLEEDLLRITDLYFGRKWWFKGKMS